RHAVQTALHGEDDGNGGRANDRPRTAPARPLEAGGAGHRPPGPAPLDREEGPLPTGGAGPPRPILAASFRPVSRTTDGQRRKNMNQPIDRKALEAKFGKVWTAQELEQEFVVTAFIGLTVVVRRKADDVVGTLEFTNRPHLFYNFQPQKGAE